MRVFIENDGTSRNCSGKAKDVSFFLFYLVFFLEFFLDKGLILLLPLKF